ncbi:MAG: hypothetical protein KDI90_04970 [Alphaproteobacteria bacterium]|nr:hypothetical protein [Alphaproteobacteria bacterium]MCB9975103.1 hypothetical protein [Rhodospirillales bacterium]
MPDQNNDEGPEIFIIEGEELEALMREDIERMGIVMEDLIAQMESGNFAVRFSQNGPQRIFSDAGSMVSFARAKLVSATRNLMHGDSPHTQVGEIFSPDGQAVGYTTYAFSDTHPEDDPAPGQ